MLNPADTQVVILAAGKGVRMRSRLPKVLHQVCGLSLLERTVRAVADFGSRNIVVVIGFGHELVAEELSRMQEEDRFPSVTIRTVIQSEQRGTGHAVQQAWPLLSPYGGQVLILPGDVPLIDAETLRATASMNEENELTLVSAIHTRPTGYGRVVRGESGNVVRVVEEKDCTPSEREIREVNTSLYWVSPQFLGRALPTLKDQNAQREYYLTDIVGYAVQSGVAVRAIEVPLTKVLGANSRSELVQLELLRRREIAEGFMAAGVSFENPADAYIEEDVTIGEDSFIGAGTRLFGHTAIGTRVTIEGESLVVESEVGEDTVLRLGCYVEHSLIGKECEIGPFAHIRPQSVLEDRVKIGNFVETKKSRMGSGAKANHLSYIGDAEVGPGANIGAGTITCNYDGIHKHRTVVGAGAFVGTNSSLVAPVTIGPGAYVGAGSVITHDVPENALGIERSDQRNVEGWALRRKAKDKDKE